MSHKLIETSALYLSLHLLQTLKSRLQTGYKLCLLQTLLLRTCINKHLQRITNSASYQPACPTNLNLQDHRSSYSDKLTNSDLLLTDSNMP